MPLYIFYLKKILMINYNFFEKFLHDLTLGNSFIKKSIFELEKIIYQKKIESNCIKFEKHIFISGLPRSGSTGILNLLYDTSEFASLTYQNMPFILAPNLSKLFIRKVENSKKKKRFHNDGVFFDHDSPEAFDQVFLKLY
ncbi:hypothetical protein AKH21_00770, partial [Pelagibacteraceae bacterium GOM-A5]